MLRTVPGLMLLTTLCSPALAVTIGQVDDFQDGATAGWGAGTQSLLVTADGGPQLAGDRYLAYESNGFGGPNSRMVIPNEGPGNQWGGDYLASGVAAISAEALNAGDTDLSLRLGIADGTTWFVSTEPVFLGANSAWTSVAFSIAADAMTRVGAGLSDFSAVARSVGRVRLISSVGLPTVSFGGTGGLQGEVIAASIGLDNIRAVGVPEPSSLVAAALVLGGVFCRRSFVH
ncbi:hypothetical protein MalM25_25230 [Planctomycetes bacterium MalM25]|nr:hypothetical protein MalM25_25230 [Planctomycetes bacterium MalM25]